MRSIWRAGPGDVSQAQHQLRTQILTFACSLFLWSERGTRMKYAHKPRGLGSAACPFSSVLATGNVGLGSSGAGKKKKKKNHKESRGADYRLFL